MTDQPEPQGVQPVDGGQQDRAGSEPITENQPPQAEGLPQADGPSAAPGADDLDAPIDLSASAFQAAINLQWEQMERLSAEAQAKALALTGPDGELVRGLTEALLKMTEGVAVQYRESDAARFDRALQLFEQGRDRLDGLHAQFPQETSNDDFQAMVTGIELSALMTTRRLARDHGDRAQALIVDAQIKTALQHMPDQYRTQQQTFQAIVRHFEIADQLKEIVLALNAMDLPQALEGITAVREDGRAALEVMRQGMDSGVVFEQSQSMISGTYDYVEALESYIRALHDAVVGDVTRAHIEQLTRAEALLLGGIKKMHDGLLILGQANAEQAEAQMESYRALITPIRNLRALCEKSLKPKSWLASGAFKFVFVFLATAVVLGVVAATNAGTGVSDRLLAGYVLLVAFVVGLIGGFGFEALRFLPFADVLSRSRPGVQAGE